MPRALVLWLVAAAVVATAACHNPTRKTLVPDVPRSGDPHALARFDEARQKFLRDGTADDFGAIVRDYPNDPIVPWAELYDGIAAVKARDFTHARDVLGKVVAANPPHGIMLRADLYLAIADNYAGDAAAARALFAALDGHPEAIENDDERTEYVAAQAYATAAGDHPVDALPIFDELWPRVTPTEQAMIAERVAAIAGVASRDDLQRVHDALAHKDGIAMAVVASRLAELAAAAGDPAAAARYRDEAAPVRAALGLPRAPAAAAAASAAGSASGSGMIGAILPLTVKNEQRVVQSTVAALGLLAGATGGSGVAAVDLRSAAGSADASAAVDDLARAGAVAVLGPIEEDAVRAAGDRANALGVPLLSLATRPEMAGAGTYVFHICHSAEARAGTLARRAVAAGVKTFVVLAPETGYGRAWAKAFADEVAATGGTVVDKETYPLAPEKDVQMAIGKAVGKLPASGWDAVFVADDARRLAQVAAPLATSGAYPKPLGTKKVIGGRPVLLLSTADGLTAEYAADAGRYSEGAWLAPGFYADPTDAASKPFVDSYLAAFGQPPGATAAYAYDAATLAAAAGGGGRGALAGKLAGGVFDGVTGAIRFDATTHLRADPGVIYTVVLDAGVYAIRKAQAP